MKEIYQAVDSNSDRSFGYFMADKPSQVKRHVVNNIKVRKLSGSEVLEVQQNGHGIFEINENPIPAMPGPQV